MVPEVVLELAELYRTTIPTKFILETLDIFKSTYYRWKNGNLPTRELSDKEIRVIEACKETKRLYDYRKITALLRREAPISRNTVQRIMQKHDLNCRVKIKRKTKYPGKQYTTKNILDRDFKTDKPLTKLVTDITYLPFGSKLLYLSSIMDCYNGEIIAYNIDDTQDVDLVLSTLNQLPEISS